MLQEDPKDIFYLNIQDINTLASNVDGGLEFLSSKNECSVNFVSNLFDLFKNELFAERVNEFFGEILQDLKRRQEQDKENPDKIIELETSIDSLGLLKADFIELVTSVSQKDEFEKSEIGYAIHQLSLLLADDSVMDLAFTSKNLAISAENILNNQEVLDLIKDSNSVLPPPSPNALQPQAFNQGVTDVNAVLRDINNIHN